MASNFMRTIVSRAIANIKKIFENKHEFGKQIGETAASMALREVVRHIVVSRSQVGVTEVERVYIDQNGSINHQSGYLVAVIYEGDDRNYYKHTADRWYVWNGQDWT